MRVPWIRVHGALFDRPVVTRLVAATHIGEHEAVGVLVTFWSGVAAHATNGVIADYPDAQLEKWARWPRKRGVFAAWVRAEHQDAEGRVPEWDDYAGALEVRRERERQRLADKRKMLRNRTQDVAQQNADSCATLQPARANGTRRDETVPTNTKKRIALPDWVPALVAVWTAHVGRTTPKKMHAACKALVDEYGLERVRGALEIYVSPDEGPTGARKPDWFAENFHRYRTLAETPLEKDGELTERARRLMARPA